jgi:hypothetical protein
MESDLKGSDREGRPGAFKKQNTGPTDFIETFGSLKSQKVSLYFVIIRNKTKTQLL